MKSWPRLSQWRDVSLVSRFVVFSFPFLPLWGMCVGHCGNRGCGGHAIGGPFLDIIGRVSEVRHCSCLPSTMSSAPRLLDIPPITPSDNGPPPVGPDDAPLDSSAEVAQATVVETALILPPTSPTPPVPPTSARPLRGQSARSFSRGTLKDTAVAGSSVSPIIADSDIQALKRVGMTPAATGESANQSRARLNENDARLAAFVTVLEQKTARQDREQSERLQEVALLVREVKAACEQQIHSPARLLPDSITAGTLVEQPAVQQLHSAVVEDRHRITELVDELRHLKTEVDGLRYQVPPSVPFIPQLPPTLSSNTKRALDGPSTPPPAKHFRSGAPQYTDVLYGPVGEEGNPRTIANAALGLIPGLSSSDVFTAKYVHNERGVLSLRFQDPASAERFVSFIERRPLLEGQTAVYAGLGGSSSVSGSGPGVVDRRASVFPPRDAIRGPQPGRNPRRR